MIVALRKKGKATTELINRINGSDYETPALPKTRYYGSKRRLSRDLGKIFSVIEANNCADIFGGTATVSLVLKDLKNNVFYNDSLLSNEYQARALLINREWSKTKNRVVDFCDQVSEVDGFVSKTFEGFYFTESENRWIDGALSKLFNVEKSDGFYEIFYCLCQSFMQKRPFNLFHRKNLYLRTNCQTESVKFRNWVTWEKTFRNLYLASVDNLNLAKSISGGNVHVGKGRSAIEIRPKYDLVYIDPPYIARGGMGASYMEKYHFLEGAAMYQDWRYFVDFNSNNRRFDSGYNQFWHNKKEFKDYIFSLIDMHSGRAVVFSYASGGYPDIDEIWSYFSSKFGCAVMFYSDVKHALRKSNERNEVIFVGVNNGL